MPIAEEDRRELLAVSKALTKALESDSFESERGQNDVVLLLVRASDLLTSTQVLPPGDLQYVQMLAAKAVLDPLAN